MIDVYKRQGMDRILDVTARLSATEQNIVLIGMPGCGKTRVGERLAALSLIHICVEEHDPKEGQVLPGASQDDERGQDDICLLYTSRCV